MTNNKDKDEWGNIELPGLSDEELYSKNWNKVAAIREVSQRDSWKENNKKAGTKRKQDQSWRQKVKDSHPISVETKRSLGTYESWTEKMKKWRESPEGIKETQKKVDLARQMGKSNSKILITPDGEFESLTKAAEFYGINKSSMSQRVRDKPEFYFYKK